MRFAYLIFEKIEGKESKIEKTQDLSVRMQGCKGIICDGIFWTYYETVLFFLQTRKHRDYINCNLGVSLPCECSVFLVSVTVLKNTLHLQCFFLCLTPEIAKEQKIKKSCQLSKFRILLFVIKFQTLEITKSEIVSCGTVKSSGCVLR